jgi:hypothetical protein
MALNSKELMDRGDDRLEAVFQQIEKGEPVDYRKLSLLDPLETAMIGRAFAREAAENDRKADDLLR